MSWSWTITGVGRTWRRRPQRSRAIGTTLAVELLEDRLTPSSGTLDPTFGAAGTVLTPISDGFDQANAVVGLADDSMLVAGSAFSNSTGYDFALAKYQGNGTLDPSFGTGGIVTTDFFGFNDTSSAMAVLPNGNIVLAGTAFNPSTGNSFALAEYLPNGTLDSSFGTGGLVTTSFFGGGDDEGFGLAIQSNGDLVVSGEAFNPVTNNYDFALARYTPAGSLDATFGSGGQVTTDFGTGSASAQSIAIDASGNIVAAGYAFTGSSNDFAVARYTPAGVLDGTFGTGGIVTTDFAGSDDFGYAVAIESSGDILVGGTATEPITGNNFALAAYTPSGALDPAFGTGGLATTSINGIDDEIHALAIQPNGQILAGGFTFDGSEYDYSLTRYNTDGSVDTSFDPSSSGLATTNFNGNSDLAYGIGIQQNGTIALVGTADDGSGNLDFGIARYLGTPETDVYLDGSNNLIVTDVAPNGGKNDDLIISQSGANLVIHDPVNTLLAGAGATQVDPFTVTVPVASITGQVEVTTDGGNDSVTLQNVSVTGFVDLGTGNNTFALTGAATLNGSVTGASNTNTLDYSGYGSGVTIDALNGFDTATGISGTFSGFANFVGSQFADTFTLQGQAYTQSVDGQNPTSAPGDVLNYVPTGGTVTTTSNTIDETGFATPTVIYTHIETLNMPIVINGGNTLVVTATSPNSGSYVLDGGPAVPFSGVSSFTWNAANGGDSMTINNQSGSVFAPVSGISYNGGTGSNSLTVDDGGGAAFNETYYESTLARGGPFTTGDGELVTTNGTTTQDVLMTGITGPVENDTPVTNVTQNLVPGDGYHVFRAGGSNQLLRVTDTTDNTVFRVTYATIHELLLEGQTTGGNSLNVDWTGSNGYGDPIPSGGIAFNGAGTGNSATLTNGVFTNVADNDTGPAAGNASFDSDGTVTYTDDQALKFSASTIANLTANLPNAANAAVLGDNGSNPTLTSTGSTFVSTILGNPTTLLTINRGSANDTLTINASPHLTSSVSAGTAGSPFLSATVAGTMDLSNGNLTLYAGTTTVSGNVTTSGATTLTALGNLTVNNPISAGAAATLTGGASGTGGLITLDAAVTGSAVNVDGGAGPDTITVNTTGNVPYTLDGMNGGDTYVVAYNSAFGTINAQVNVRDSGTTGSDSLVVDGTTAGTTYTVNEQSITPVGLPAVNYDPLIPSTNATLTSITLHGSPGGPVSAASDDTFNVSPSRYAAFTIDGGPPSFGQAGVPPGDTLNLNPGGNSFQLNGNVITVNGGSPAYQPITFYDVENLPVIPTGTTTAHYQMLGTPTSPVQAGYTGVTPTQLFNGTYGWVSIPTGGYDRGTAALETNYATNPYAKLEEGGQYSGQSSTYARTFEAAVANGYYLVSIKVGDTKNNGAITVTDANTSQVLVNNLLTTAGQFAEKSFVVDVTGGVMRLTFSDNFSAGGYYYWLLNGIDIRPALLLTEGFATVGPLAADGGTIDSVTLQGATPNSEVTVTTSAGSIVTSDIDPYQAGIQVLTNGSGQATIQIQRPTGQTNAYVNFEEVSGAQTGLGTIEYTVPTQRMFDFGTATSPVQAPAAPANANGWIGASPATTYNATNGYGWVSGPISAFDRGTVSATPFPQMLEDGNYSGEGTTYAGYFRADVPNGNYLVTVFQGDENFGYSQENTTVVVGSGPGLQNVSSVAGQWADNTFPVTVSSGYMELEFTTTAAYYWVVNGLIIRANNPSSVVPVSFTSGPGSVTADGATIDTIHGTAAVPNGTQLTITSNLGTVIGPDVNSAVSGVQVTVTGGTFQFELQRPFTAGTPALTATALDGSAFGTATNATIVSYTATATGRFDFLGGSYAPPSGFVGVLNTQVYSPTLGYGWTAPVQDYDRGSAPGTTTVNLYRGGAWNYGGTAGTFEVAETPGSGYNVRVYLYDATHSWTNLSVTVDGVTQNVASLPAGTKDPLVFSGVTVPGTGILSVTMNSTGYAWIANGIDVWTTTDPGAAPQLAAGGEGNNTKAQALTQAELKPIVKEAITAWDNAGLPQADRKLLSKATFTITTLPSGVLGLTPVGGTTVTLSSNAAGWGWFIDPTPAGNSEFAKHVTASDLLALPGSKAYGEIDLLTVVEHELGHVLGLEDVNPTQVPNDVMTQTLGTGERRLPTTVDLASVIAALAQVKKS